ncbi:MAG: Rv1733c family protein [Streptosporangiaceae bacterium]
MSLRHPLANRTRGCARNPLRRRIDDVETAILTGVVVLFLIAAPLLAIMTGRLADAAGVREQGAERAWHPVQAVLEQNASAGLSSQDGAWGAAWVKALWNIPGGKERIGVIGVGLNARAGQRVTIWVTGSGQVTHPPLSHGEVLDGIANAVLATVVGVGVLLGLAAATARAAANRRRMAAWGRAWDVIGPRWTSLR